MPRLKTDEVADEVATRLQRNQCLETHCCLDQIWLNELNRLSVSKVQSKATMKSMLRDIMRSSILLSLNEMKLSSERALIFT
ncbi:MAG: hypothetical protein CMH49_08515 [Myxococcales bacterium]|nr:hypothetical protein [Myxococcales bacterium]